MRTLSLLLCLAASPRAQVILSEALADPSAVPDAQGEFIELANLGPGPVSDIALVVDGDSLRLDGAAIPAGAFLLLCRDSVRAENGGLPCDRQVALSLPNTRNIPVTVVAGGARRDFLIPAARPGVSWENTFEEAQGFARFSPGALAAADGDSATPGARNSRDVRRARVDLALESLRFVPGVSQGAGPGGALRARVASKGSETPAFAAFAVTTDADWDGVPDGPADTVTRPWPGGATADFDLPMAAPGSIVQVTLGRDEDPSDDAARLLVPGARSLEITELCPAPAAGRGPEWAEIRNAGAAALSLARVEAGGAPLGKGAGVLAPGEFAVVTEDAAAFRSFFGPLKIRLFQPAGWRTLRNTGDTARISVAGLPVDALRYDEKQAASGCIVRAPTDAGSGAEGPGADPTAAQGPGPAPAPQGPDSDPGGNPSGVADSLPAVRGVPEPRPTPGFAVPADEGGFGWEFSSRVIRPGSPLEVTLRIPSPGSYVVRAFDLEGNIVRELGRGGPGRNVHAWDGTGMPTGPYVIALTAEGHPALKRAVVIAP